MSSGLVEAGRGADSANCKRQRYSPSPRRPALLSSSSENGKPSRGQRGTSKGKDHWTHLERS
jgi:hypothetical protein